MRGTIATVLALSAAPVLAGPVPEQTAVRRAAQDLLDSWRQADAAKGAAAMHPDFRLTTRKDNFAADDIERTGTLPVFSVATRAAMIALYPRLKLGSWDDRLSDVQVRVDPTGMATLWAGYRFHIDGKLTHCGQVTMTLYRLDGRWQITEFADTHHWAQPGEPNGCRPPSG